VKYRRRYKCPHCKRKGRVACNSRDKEIIHCGYCHTRIRLEIQNETGTGYREFNELADRMEYEI